MKIKKYLFLLIKSKCLYFKFKKAIKKAKSGNSQMLHFDMVTGRCIGKTYNLLKLSGECNIPVIEPFSGSDIYYEKEVKKFNPVIFSRNEVLSSFRESKYGRPGSLVLVDEFQMLDDRARKFIVDNYNYVAVETSR